MDPEEQELLSDYRYRNYSSVIEKALRNFESSSEWADLISSLGKLNKALQSNLRYSLLPRRLVISKRLAQCLHPALPSGVHLKALETYEIIFKIVGTKWLAKDLFLYSCGLFPLLAHAAMSVRPVLLGLYEKYFLPLQKLLLPSLQAFVVGLLPGLEEGSEIYDRTDALLLRLSLVVGREVFYAALWGSVLASPSIRLPASLFVVGHINRGAPGREQKYMLGTDYQLTVKSLCASLLDSNVLVQRNNLEIVLFFFPFYTCLDSNERAIPLLRSDIVRVLSAATQTLLRRDMSLNRRLYAWLLGSDIKGNTIVPESEVSNVYEDQSVYFFEKYSKDLLVEGLAEILHQKFPDIDVEERHHGYLKPFRILVSLLDKPEIGPQVVENLFLEVIRAFYSYCRDALGSDLKLSYTQSGNSVISAIKENRNASEIVKTVNLLITSLSSDFLWDYMTRCFEDCFRPVKQSPSVGRIIGPPPTVSELCTLLVFLLDVIPLELYSEVQTQYLPQVLGCLLQPLAEEMEMLSLPELTHALRTCFKVLSKVQMPPSYLDTEPTSGSLSPVRGENTEVISDTDTMPAGDEDAPFPPLKSEDSGIGLSASSPELSEHLRVPRVSPDKDDVWKKGGSMQRMFLCIQELIANFAHKNVFGEQLTVSGEDTKSAEEPAGPRDEGGKGSWEARPLGGVPQFKQMLSDLFTARGSPFKARSMEPPSPPPRSPSRKKDEGWAVHQVVLNLRGSREGVREAFAAACHLLLDCATFPVYLSEEETEQLCEVLFQPPGAGDSGFPPWLKSLMTISCCVTDCYLQNVAISTLLEVINHSQSLALVIEDKMKRYKSSGHNPFFGKLQMVTVPPIAPGILRVIAEKTDFYQRVAHVLWNQLNKETQEHHITCVELFYRLHCLAPTANVCEDIICHALLNPDKGTRLEALFRFSVIWHLTREIQGSRVTSHNRSFDRSLFVVLDSLGSSDGAIGAAAQGWLVRALSLGDAARILEPVLLLLLQPKTQRTAIHCLTRENSAEDWHRWLNRKQASFAEAWAAPELPEDGCEDGAPLSQLTTVDREAIWAEVETEPEARPTGGEPHEHDRPMRLEDLLDGQAHTIAEDGSERTESADTSSGATDSSENTSSVSSPVHDPQELSGGEQCCAPLAAATRAPGPQAGGPICLARADSDRTQASESLPSSDEEAAAELQALTAARLRKQQRERQAMLEALFAHILLYLQPYDSRRVLYAFSVLETVLKTNPREFIEAVSRTSVDTSATAHLNLISNLLARHQEALAGQSFYGKLPSQPPSACPHSLLIELLTYLCLNFLRSYYPCSLRVSHRDILGNRDVQVKSVEVLIRVMTQLVSVAKAAAEQLRFQSDSEDNVKKLQEEIQKIKLVSEDQILCLQKQLEIATNKKEQEITHLQGVIEANCQQYQKDINSLQEELVQLKSTHQEEVKELMCQIETSAKEHEAEVNYLIQLKDNLVRKCEAGEMNIQEKYKCELENEGKASGADQENQVCSLLLQEDSLVEQAVNEKVRHLEDALKELESQHSILKDELTYMNNLKLKLEIDAQHIKDEFFHEREDLEFKINELLLAKEEQGYIIEKLKSELEDANKQFCCTIEQHNKEVQSLKKQHQKETELNETFLSDSEKEKLTLMFEIQGLKEQCEKLQQEKQEAMLNYEGLREIMEILQTELGESAEKISQEFESMKQQQAFNINELQQKLQTAFNEKDALLETVNCLQRENDNLLSQRECVPELENTIKNLQEKNELYLVSLSQRDTMLQEFEAKISSLTEEKYDFISKMKSSHEEMDNLHKKCEREERLTVELREKVDQTAQYNSELEQKVNELTAGLEETLKEKDEKNQKLEKLTAQLKTLSEDQEAMSLEVRSLREENSRLSLEKNLLSRDLEALLSQKEGDVALQKQISEVEEELRLAVRERDDLNKLLENQQVQKLFVKAQLCGFLEQMESKVSQEREEQDVVNILQAMGESLDKINEEKYNLAFQYDERKVELEKKIKLLQEEHMVQCEELRSLLTDYEQEKVVLRKELEEALLEKEALQSDLLEMKNAGEQTRFENQNLLIQVEEMSQKLCRENENHHEKEKDFIKELENLRSLLEQKESELQNVKAELISLKDSFKKSPSVESDQPSVKEFEEKIGYLEKEAKEKEEKISKLKLVAVKAKKELDSSRKEAQTLQEELEFVRSERDQLSTSMRDLIQGAENYKNLLSEYDKQSEQLDAEKERANNFEHQVEDLTRQLRSLTFQCEKLTSDNEDFLARIETLQSNACLLEVQILEVQKAKAMADKELEAEKLQKEQKIKEYASSVNELEELQLQLQKEKKQLQKTMQELELVRKDAQQTTLMNMEIADYERLMRELNQKLANKNSKIEDLEQEIKIQKQKQETLQEEMTSLQAVVQQYEEKNTKIKQLLVKTKKELADVRQAETDHLKLQASLKGELEASQQQVEVYKIQLAEVTAEKHKAHEHLKASADQHQRTLGAYQQRVSALQEECREARAEQAAVASEFESYKVRVHNVLKQQKNKSVSQTEAEGAKQEREHLEMLIDQLKLKLQDTQNSLQISASELQALQCEHCALLERHNRVLQEAVGKEAELREKLCSVQSENSALMAEHTQTVDQLTAQHEALRGGFREQVRQLQEEHRRTVETLQQQLCRLEAQLLEPRSEPATRSPASSQQPLRSLRERRSADLPFLDVQVTAREEGEGMETTDLERGSPTSTAAQSLEQLLSSPEARLEPPAWHNEFTKEELVQKLNSTTKSADHLNGLLRETEATNAILMEQIKLLKSEVRRLERNQEREKSAANLEYLKNVLLQFILLKPGSERARLLPVVDTMLQLSPEEKTRLAAAAQGEESGTRSSGWASYLHSWSGLR